MEAAPPTGFAGEEAADVQVPPPSLPQPPGTSWQQESGSGGPESLTSLLQNLLEAGHLEPKLEVLVTEINRVQQARRVLCRELDEYREQSDKAKRELDQLKTERLQLEQALNKNQETLQRLQLQCDRKGTEKQREKELSDTCQQRIEYLTSKIQEEKLKQRKQRMEYEKQVEELMAKHKNLWELYDEKRLCAEMPLMEERKVKLIEQEREIQGQMAQLQEEIEKLRKQGVNVTAEAAFLRSAQAKTAVLFEEEYSHSKQILDKTTERHRSVCEMYTRFCKEWDAARKNMPEPSVDQMISGVQSEGAQIKQPPASQEE
ncbi:synaptonemal complex central element protein 1 isoform X2 [Xenopus laevis]|uniref:Synaptonemal complex central element protein 1 isoform X2 n=1 Tax=Xenopus laevis TaxID=8355 RepID=A0A8J0TQD2_XENLA|nr:synaptonemal complex central element protein 1 isoform X2 [Xenopus laevis]